MQKMDWLSNSKSGSPFNADMTLPGVFSDPLQIDYGLYIAAADRFIAVDGQVVDFQDGEDFGGEAGG